MWTFIVVCVAISFIAVPAYWAHKNMQAEERATGQVRQPNKFDEGSWGP